MSLVKRGLSSSPHVKRIIGDKDPDKGLADKFKKIIPNFYVADY